MNSYRGLTNPRKDVQNSLWVPGFLALVLIAVAALGALPGGAAADETAVSWCDSPGPSDLSETADCLALEALYNATNGAAWSNTENVWFASTAACTWHGVQCSGSRVISVDLYENNLTGTLPAELGDLSALTVLALGRNHVTGPIPAEIGGLTGLQTLDLGDNKLSGSIPASIGDLTNLDLLFLESNQLGGAVPQKVCDLTPTSWTVSYNKLDVSTTAESCTTNHSGWSDTQTVPPAGLSVAASAVNTVQGTAAVNATITLDWVPIDYQGNGGGYQVYTRNLTSNAIQARGTRTNGKAVTGASVTISGDPRQFAFFVRTETDAHDDNQSALVSEPSSEQEIEAVAVRLLDVEANVPLLYVPALAPLLLLLLSLAATFIFRRR